MLTINELIDSPRFKIANEVFPKDSSLMKAMLVELVHETMNVVKSTLVKIINTRQGLDKFEIVPLLRGVMPDEYRTFNIYWGMSDVEQKLYLAKVNGATPEELQELTLKVKSKLGIDG